MTKHHDKALAAAQAWWEKDESYSPLNDPGGARTEYTVLHRRVPQEDEACPESDSYVCPICGATSDEGCGIKEIARKYRNLLEAA